MAWRDARGYIGMLVSGSFGFRREIKRERKEYLPETVCRVSTPQTAMSPSFLSHVVLNPFALEFNDFAYVCFSVL